MRLTNKNKLKKFLPIIFFIFSLSYVGMSHAGALDDFEKDATKPNKKSSKRKSDSKPTNNNNNNHSSDGIPDPFEVIEAFDGLGKGTFFLIKVCSSSWMRLNYDMDSSYKKDVINLFALHPREAGETLIPYFRFDYHYQILESNIYASDYRVVAGYGPLAFMARNTYLREKSPPDKLKIEQAYGVLRMSFTKYVEVGLGFGDYTLAGNNKNSGGSTIIPIAIRFNKNVTLEFLPAWADINDNRINDYDLGILLGSDYWSAKIGYRRIETPNDYLQGPYLGVSFYY